MNDNTSAARLAFADLHREGCFIMPNPWDVGSAKLLANAGFRALATTSAGLAWSLGCNDQQLTREQVVGHTRQLATATALPLNVDSERCYADDLIGIAETIALLDEAGASGCSIEDFDPATSAIDAIDVAAERVAAAAEAAHSTGGAPLLLTARCENFLYGLGDLDDTITRLRAYATAGADCVYAPGLSTVEQIQAVVESVEVPVNVLAWPGGPTVAEIAAAGARRVSVGAALANVAYGALMNGARELLTAGTTSFRAGSLKSNDWQAFQSGSTHT